MKNIHGEEIDVPGASLDEVIATVEALHAYWQDRGITFSHLEPGIATRLAEWQMRPLWRKVWDWLHGREFAG